MILKILFFLIPIILILFILFYSNDKYSSCIFNPKTNNSYIYIDSKQNIKNIQKSLNNQDNVYYIDNGNLYYNNKLIKRLVECSKDNMNFMMNKYGVGIVN